MSVNVSGFGRRGPESVSVKDEWKDAARGMSASMRLSEAIVQAPWYDSIRVGSREWGFMVGWTRGRVRGLGK